jgi:peptide deformylase
MIKEIIVYPTPPSVEYATDVRSFNQELHSLIDDLKDTIVANDLKGLAAYQIGSFYNVIVIRKDDDSFLELINPRLISTKNKIITTEKTAYFPNLSADVERFEHISVVYQDRNAKDQVIKASGELSILLQRKIDYTFGSTFLNKLSKEEKQKFEKKLEYGADVTIAQSCPTVSYKDYILKGANILLVVIFILFLYSLFVDQKETLEQIWSYQLYTSYGTIFMGIFYFIYAYYEGKKNVSCTSCQIGNQIGTLAILFTRLTAVMVLSYFFV